MKIKSAEFVLSAPSRKFCPSDGLAEVVLIGRSNVGKSSLINTILCRKGLAKTSSTPGKTRTINFYRINEEFYIVDLPGFGYAQAPKSVQRSWEKMIRQYLEERSAIRCAMVVLDARRDLGETEEVLYKWLYSYGLNVVTVFTKIDKLSNNQLASRAAIFKKALKLGTPTFFSAVTGAGKDDLLKRISRAVHDHEAERAAAPINDDN